MQQEGPRSTPSATVEQTKRMEREFANQGPAQIRHGEAVGNCTYMRAVKKRQVRSQTGAEEAGSAAELRAVKFLGARWRDQVHRTHKLATSRCKAYCVNCGRFASHASRIRRLRGECPSDLAKPWVSKQLRKLPSEGRESICEGRLVGLVVLACWGGAEAGLVGGDLGES